MKANGFIFKLLLVMSALVFCQCRDNSERWIIVDNAIPEAPDYKQDNQWYVSDRNGDADIFYVISTETGDYTLSDGSVCHYADTYNDSVRGPLLGEMKGVDRLVSGDLNFYSPYYRQCSLQSYTDEELTEKRMKLPTEDVRKAFRYYLRHLNQGRPFILAGFSQGAIILLDLLKEMDKTTYDRLIAAYVIGWSVPEEMVRDCPYIKGAQRADDTGVTICYNSCSHPDSVSVVKPRSAIAINPVNWRTDTTSAVLMTEPTPLLPVEEQQKDTMLVHLDPVSNRVIVEGYSATDYVLPLIGKEGDYHSREIWLYRDQLRENMALRSYKKLGMNTLNFEL